MDNANCSTAQVNPYGHSLNIVTGVKHVGIKRLHDLFVNLLSKWLRRAKISPMSGVGGYKHTRNSGSGSSPVALVKELYLFLLLFFLRFLVHIIRTKLDDFQDRCFFLKPRAA